MASKLSTLWQLVRGQRLRYAGAVVAMAAGIVLLYLSPLVIRATIDGSLDPQPVAGNEHERHPFARIILSLAGADAPVAHKLILAGVLIAGLTGLGGLFTYLRGRWSAYASESIAKRLRERLYDHLQHLPCAYHDKAQTGDLVQRCTSDVDTVRQFYATQVVEIGRAVILILTVVPILMLLDWRMGLVSLAMLPVIILFAVFFFARVQKSFKAMDEAEGAMTTVLQENLTGIRVVRAFARHDFEKTKFAGKNGNHRDLNYRLFKLMAVYWASSDFMTFMQMALVLLVGAWRVSHGHMSIGTLVAFQTYVGMFIWPLRQMGRVLSELGKAMVSLRRLEEILNQPRESATDTSDSRTPAADAPRIRGDLAFRGVTFSHAGKTVVDGVSFSVRAGETLAILGPSGSGKSTLIHLLLRLYDHEQGAILLDGQDVRTLDRKHVRRQCGVVMQEPFLYSKALRDNLRLGRHDAGDEEVVEAASMACVHDSIESFEKKYDTLVGERGVTLSGGQRQRVAIARALLKDAPILILDDALSAVDTRTETLILDALKRRRGRHTTLIIAHRLSTLMHADRIIVLERGRVAQEGTHDQLVAQQGLYRRLWQIQGALEEDLRSELAETATTRTTTDIITAAAAANEDLDAAGAAR